MNSINIKSMKSMKHSDYHGKLLRLVMIFVALFLYGTMSYAQTDRMISGIVVDENGAPLPAAHIRQVSQTKGEELAAVITDMNGHFRLTLLRTAKEIEVSFLGYESKKSKTDKCGKLQDSLGAGLRTAGRGGGDRISDYLPGTGHRVICKSGFKKVGNPTIKQCRLIDGGKNSGL